MATIYQNAAEISVCTQNIDQAILEHGIEMDGGGLRSASGRIRSIPKCPTLSSISISAEGIYEAPEDIAYDTISVDIAEWDDPYTFKALYNCLSDVSIPLSISQSLGGIVCSVDWGDGNMEQSKDWTNITHTYAARGKYLIQITPIPSYQTEKIVFNGNLFISNPGIEEVWLPNHLLVGYTNAHYTYSQVVKFHYPKSGLLMTGGVCEGIMSKKGGGGVGELHNRATAAELGLGGGNNNTAISPVDSIYYDNLTAFYGQGWYNGNAVYGLKYLIFANPEITQDGTADYVCASFVHVVKMIGLNKMTIKGGRYLFNNSTSLVELPDTLDITQASIIGLLFNGGTSALLKLPTHVTAGVSFSWKNCTKVTDKDSVATFDDSGTVNGGFVGNLNSLVYADYASSEELPETGERNTIYRVTDASTSTTTYYRYFTTSYVTTTSTAQTAPVVTFNSSIKALFTDDQIAAIETCLSEKNWGCAWA